ncbi:MAG: 16S rRNA (uracil(1498)-N(3))-methyltransferase [Blastocatellia bacterium]|nr:16S rRNA (uracil(1498)-N(3))-methyltransferase [Blastocatellia bacterium]
MQRHRFYAPPAQFDQSTVTLDPDESHHLARVLRLGEGAHVFVFDGQGDEWECEVARMSKSAVALKLLRQLEDAVESPLKLTLAQALIKGDKFDWLVQKATELGVTRIVPLLTDHSNPGGNSHRPGDRAGHRLERWQRIAIEAVKQCGRRTLVEIAEPIDYESFCENAAGMNNLIFSERGGQNLREVAAKLGCISGLRLLVAPEGGWSEGELQLGEKTGFIPVHLGSRILRAETAGIAAVILSQHLFGDIG